MDRDNVFHVVDLTDFYDDVNEQLSELKVSQKFHAVTIAHVEDRVLPVFRKVVVDPVSIHVYYSTVPDYSTMDIQAAIQQIGSSAADIAKIYELIAQHAELTEDIEYVIASTEREQVEVAVPGAVILPKNIANEFWEMTE